MELKDPKFALRYLKALDSSPKWRAYTIKQLEKSLKIPRPKPAGVIKPLSMAAKLAIAQQLMNTMIKKNRRWNRLITKRNALAILKGKAY